MPKMDPDQGLGLAGYDSYRFQAEILYLEGQGDLVRRLIMGITRVTICVIGVIDLLTKSP